MVGLLTLSLLHLLTPAPPAPPGGATLWAGHQIARGQRELPLRGVATTRMDTFTLARIARRGDQLEIVEQACAVRLAPVGGARVTIDARALPVSRMILNPAGTGSYEGISRTGWGREDRDGDGAPGIAVQVDAPICAGTLHVSSVARTRLTLGVGAGWMQGAAEIEVAQQILEVKGACLSLLAGDTREQQRARVAYVPVPARSTCASLGAGSWPVDAERGP